MLGFFEEDHDDDSPERLERDFELEKPYWATVGLELLVVATERRTRLKTMLARHQDHQVEARPGLAAEASLDDTAEGERVHRYQERWQRSLLRTLAEIGELRSRGPLDDQEAEAACMGHDSHPVLAFEEYANSVIACIEDRRLQSCPPTGGRDVNEGPDEAHRVEETERGYHRVTVDDPPLRREQKRQNKRTAVTRTVVRTKPCALGPLGNKATMARSICRRSHESGQDCRPRACGAVVNYSCCQSLAPPRSMAQEHSLQAARATQLLFRAVSTVNTSRKWKSGSNINDRSDRKHPWARNLLVAIRSARIMLLRVSELSSILWKPDERRSRPLLVT